MSSITLCLLTLLSWSCGQKSVTVSAEAGTQNVETASDQDGIVVASVTSDSTKTQVVQASTTSDIKGTTVAFPPGTLTISADVTIQTGDTLTSAATAADLSLQSTDLSATSKTVVVQASSLASAAQPFTIAIPTTTSSSLVDTTTAVLYRVTKGTDLTTFYTGIMDSSMVTITASTVEISTKWFGAYQLVHSAVSLTSVQTVKTFQPIITQSQVSTNLNGTWLEKCSASSDDSSSDQYETQSLVIDGSTITATQTNYNDSGCTQAAIDNTIFATFVIDNSAKTTDGSTGFNVIFTKSFLKPRTTAQATTMNAQKFCNLTNWQNGVAVDVSSTLCDADNKQADGTTLGTTIYMLYKLVGSTLYVNSGGDESPPTTPAARPTSMDSDHTQPYIKQ